MDSYKRDVQKSQENKDDKRFLNSSVEHAQILIEQILLDADKDVKILADTFDENFYNKIYSNFEEFLKKPASQLNIVSSLNSENNLLFIKLKNNFEGKVHINFIEQNRMPEDKKSKETINFIVNDKSAYRYEYSDKNLNIGCVEAIANFNNQKESDFLIKVFNNTKEHCIKTLDKNIAS